MRPCTASSEIGFPPLLEGCVTAERVSGPQVREFAVGSDAILSRERA
jgi:hypothetical protein